MRKIIAVMVVVSVFLLITVGMVSANPGINVSVTPVKDSVLIGETAIYNITVSSLETLGMDTETVTLDVDNKIADATYTFSNNGFEIGPHPDTETVTLTIDVSSMTAPGIYPQTVTAEAEWMGIPAWEYSEFTTYIHIDTQTVPALTPLGIMLLIGLMALVGFVELRRRG